VRTDFFVPLMMSPQLLSDPKAASLEARDARTRRTGGGLRECHFSQIAPASPMVKAAVSSCTIR
jgi:hypothetical protein